MILGSLLKVILQNVNIVLELLKFEYFWRMADFIDIFFLFLWGGGGKQ